MPQIPGSPAYGLAAADPPRDRGDRWAATLGAFLAYLDASRSRARQVRWRTLRAR